jgi:hypothetical protein
MSGSSAAPNAAIGMRKKFLEATFIEHCTQPFTRAMPHPNITRIKPKPKVFLQFRITLQMDEPQVWRVIQVPGEFSFWELHIAIQDAMGWLGYHLHEFRHEQRPSGHSMRFGIPLDDDEIMNPNLLPCWNVNIGDHFRRPGDEMYYVYDFGDNWVHEVLLEGVLLWQKGLKLPRCIDGRRAAPPEDCGGPSGYADLLEVLSDPAAEGHEEVMTWLRDQQKGAGSFDPEIFDITKVKFSNPAKRLEKLRENL